MRSLEGRVGLGLLLAACGGTDDPADVGPLRACPEDAICIEPDPQREGDPQAGYDALVNSAYVTCGLPKTAYTAVFGAEAPASDRLPGRTGDNAVLPYDRTVVRTASGVDAITTNCLSCHAARINGELVVGLGNHAADFTGDQASALPAAAALLSDPAELDELARFAKRAGTLAPFVRTETIGANPADNIAAVLFAHRNRDTMQWHDEPLLELPPTTVVPVDVPPWWWMKKKNAMFYVAAGRGDHARTMMAASTLCTDDIDEARAIDAYFPDIHAYVLTIEAPAYPFAIDEALAARGQKVFEATCSRCHGTYGEDGYYPNRVLPIEEIGTDDFLAAGTSHFVGRFIEWFNEGFYGEVSRLEPFPGYIAPPLDGVWATAPYFHNASVPTVASVLDSTSRPTYWTRDHSDSTAYDSSRLGWQYEELTAGHDAVPPAERPAIYDTTKLGYGNEGHTFGDALSAADREAVIEYLKTL